MTNWSSELREARHNKKLTLEQLGELIGMSKHYLSCMERGVHEPRISTLEKVFNALEYDLVVKNRNE